MKLYFIRHGVTQGNLERRYVGRTDEGILEEEKEGQTAELLFGKNQTEIIEDFREMDFGVFEYKNYQELSGNPDYQKFIDSGGNLGFPGGEEPEYFKRRCRQAFQSCVQKSWENRWNHVGFVLHGGTIMAILEAFVYPQRGYYEYQTGNGCGFVCRVADNGDEEKYDKRYIKLIIEEDIT